ncbi:hypothetical protein BVY11_17670 [Pseudomonas amygdali pv. morsprunorum]|nr:hypothetical protein BVY11_17670 [Pseudomonas amygdali pv. morsprunorum]PPS33540.1 hypothetical protein BVY12_16300 [Pseudomonas amygdali pv. morsprunorum]
MIRIDPIWLVSWLMDMRAGTEMALAKVIAMFGASQPYCNLLHYLIGPLKRTDVCSCPYRAFQKCARL